MAFDYCTVREAFDYGNNEGNATNPVNEAGVMARCVTAVSRAIDNRCHQNFSSETYTEQVLHGVVDTDGTLTCYPPVPTMSAPSVAEYRAGNGATWLSLGGATIDIEEANHGATVRFLGLDLSAIRFGRIQVRLSYSGGYADLAALPADLRWAAQALAWFEYKRREATQDQTAIPELGIITIPGQWPANVRQILDDYTKVVPA